MVVNSLYFQPDVCIFFILDWCRRNLFAGYQEFLIFGEVLKQDRLCLSISIFLPKIPCLIRTLNDSLTEWCKCWGGNPSNCHFKPGIVQFTLLLTRSRRLEDERWKIKFCLLFWKWLVLFRKSSLFRNSKKITKPFFPFPLRNLGCEFFGNVRAVTK